MPDGAKRRVGIDFEITDNIKSEMEEIIVAEHSNAIEKKIVELQILPTVNILAIKRNDVYIAPNGSTKIHAGDILHVLAEDKSSLEHFRRSLDLKT